MLDLFFFCAESIWLCYVFATGNGVWIIGASAASLSPAYAASAVTVRCHNSLHAKNQHTLQASLFFLSPTRFAVLYTLSNLCAIAR